MVAYSLTEKDIAAIEKVLSGRNTKAEVKIENGKIVVLAVSAKRVE